MDPAPSVYALASAPPEWERQIAATLLTKEGAMVAGRSAAHRHDFPGFGASRPMIMIGLSGNARSPLARVIRSQRFESVRRVRRRGFTATDKAETVMTLARDLDEVAIEPLVDALLARKSVSVAELIDVVRLSDDVPGVPKLRRIVEDRAPTAYQPPTSELERLLYRLLDDPRLPNHTRQMADVVSEGRCDRRRLHGRVASDRGGDGRRWHTRRADMARDRLRDNEATAHGCAVLRFIYEQLRDGPPMCLDTLLRTGRVRQAS